MPTLTCKISQSLLDAIDARRRQSGETVDHIVTRALSDALQVDHATLFQISTSRALVQGVTKGAVTVDELLQHGDFGVGTFDGFDGEMVLVDGTSYQVTRDGVRVAPGDALVPFAVATHFLPERTAEFAAVASFDELIRRLDGLRNTGNEFFAVRIDGRFGHVKTRAVVRTDGPTSLTDAAARQAEFAFDNIEGLVVGFWTPDYAKSLNIAGWHLHFLTGDRLGGGHLLACAGTGLRVQVQHISDFRMAIPETAEFLRADLTQDTSREIDRAERDR